jgi:cytochrome P450
MTTAPGVTQWLPLPYGEFGEFLGDPLGYLLRARERFGDVVRFYVGPLAAHFLFQPDHVRHVLQDRQKDYPRGWHYRLVRNLLGENLVVSEGAYWLRQRRLAQPAFARQRLVGYAQTMMDATAQTLARWEHVGELDIAAEMTRLTLAIAGRTLFSRDTGQEADAVGRSFRVLAAHLEHRFNHPFTSLPTWVPTPDNYRMRAAARTLNGVVSAIIRQRRREGRDHGDLLSMLLQARDEETGEAMTDDQLRSEALTFLVAGHETTATALTWAWYLLASHAPTRRLVRDEVRGALGGRPPTPEDVPRLSATRMLIEEAMRLFPPIWGVAREAARDDEVGGFHIPKGSTVLVSQFVTHRHPAIWERPEEFDPGHFAPQAVAARPKYAYFPFLGGPHQCIGNEFAMLEMVLVVAMALQRFDMELLPGQNIRPRASLTLRPSGPVRIALKRRAAR